MSDSHPYLHTCVLVCVLTFGHLCRVFRPRTTVGTIRHSRMVDRTSASFQKSRAVFYLQLCSRRNPPAGLPLGCFVLLLLLLGNVCQRHCPPSRAQKSYFFKFYLDRTYQNASAKSGGPDPGSCHLGRKHFICENVSLSH